MSKELAYRFVILFISLILIILAFFVNSLFGLTGLILYLFFIVVFLILIIIELYLRIQHNVDSKFSKLAKGSAGFDKIGEQLEEHKEIQNKFVDFFEEFLDFLKDNKIKKKK